MPEHHHHQHHNHSEQQAETGAFHPHAPHDHHHAENVSGGAKHHPGVKVGNAAVPDSHVELHAPGTAPADRSFKPDPSPENRGFDDPTRDPLDQGGPGYTSLDADRGAGAPISGMSSEERHHDGRAHNKREHSGLIGLAKDYDVNTGREEVDKNEQMK